jgi:hypothetical protein
MGHGSQAIGGLTESELEEVRRLRGLVQAEVVEKNMSLRNATMWAVRNEIERLEDNES